MVEDAPQGLQYGACVRHSAADLEVISVFGDIDVVNVDELEARLREAAQPGLPIVVDLTACEFLSAAGLGAIASAEASAPRNVKVIAGPAFQRLFGVAGLTRLLAPPDYVNRDNVAGCDCCKRALVELRDVGSQRYCNACIERDAALNRT
jgi:anti-anti-sigma factor